MKNSTDKYQQEKANVNLQKQNGGWSDEQLNEREKSKKNDNGKRWGRKIWRVREREGRIKMEVKERDSVIQAE